MEVLDKETAQQISDILINCNQFQLSRKAHIQKYYMLRQLHSEILTSMGNYLISEKYNNIFSSKIKEIAKNYNIYLDLNDADDLTIILELFAYNNDPSIPSLTDIFLKNKRIKKPEKIKFLESMNNSYAGLFEVINVDRNNGYVTYQDVFTKKKFKIIDISMSSTLCIDKQLKIYSYNRIITFDDISFATGIHCNFLSTNNLLIDFIKTHDYENSSSFDRCLNLYKISKKDKSLTSRYHNTYN